MKSNDPTPEKILVIGNTGSGKSQCWASIAAKQRVAGSDARFYVVNTDVAGTVERIGIQWPDFTDNVQWTNVRDWDSLVEATTKYRGVAEAGDWIVVDSADNPWQWVRDAYDEWWGIQNNVKPQGMFGIVELPKDDKKWDRINGEYFSWERPLLDADMTPAHVLCTSPSQPIRVEGMFKDDEEIVEQYSRFGVRWSGQKKLGFDHHSLILLKNKSAHEWTMTMMKDRGRSFDDNTKVIDFSISYLLQIGGWSL